MLQDQITSKMLFHHDISVSGIYRILLGGGFGGRLATSVCQLRHDRMEQGPTEPHAGRSTFLLSFGGAGGGGGDY